VARKPSRSAARAQANEGFGDEVAAKVAEALPTSDGRGALDLGRPPRDDDGVTREQPLGGPARDLGHE
jgi:hypothetical protein